MRTRRTLNSPPGLGKSSLSMPTRRATPFTALTDTAHSAARLAVALSHSCAPASCTQPEGRSRLSQPQHPAPCEQAVRPDAATPNGEAGALRSEREPPATLPQRAQAVLHSRPRPEAGHRGAGTAPAAAPPRDEAAAPQGQARGGGSAARCPLLTPCGAAPGLQRVASSRVVPRVVPLETLPKAESPRSRSVGG